VSGHRLYVFFSFILLLYCPLLLAQEKKEPGQRDTVVPGRAESPLPKIELPEFLITGQETIDLPVSSKSIVEEERVLILTSPSPGRKDVDVTLASKQQKDIASPVGRMDGRVLAGFGNYVTPSLEGWFGKNYGEGAVLFHADFASSNGHVANAQWQKTGVGVHGDYLSPQSFGFVGGSRLNGGFGFSGESYRAYGSINPSQLRTLNDVHVNFGLSSRVSNSEELENQVTYSGGVAWNRVALDDSANASESEFGVSGNAVMQRKSYQLFGIAEYKVAGVTMPLPPSLDAHSPQWLALRISGKTFITPSLQGSLTVQQFVYRGSISSSSGRFYPNIELRYFVNDAVTLYANYTPTVERNTLGSLVQMNKYVRNMLELQPSEIPVSFSLGSEISLSDNLRGRGVFNYRRVQEFPVYIELNSAKVWDVMYLPDVRVISFDAQATYQFSQKNNGSLIVTFNSTAEKDSSNSVPNVPSLTLAATDRHAFDNGVVLAVFAEYVSKRWTDFAHSNANAGYVTFGGRGEYQLFDNFRMFLQVNNFLNQQYYVWDGYVERPLFVSLGVTYKW
jgi:outer membrane receptor protein involved in Fe transport